MEMLFLNDLKHIFDISLLAFTVTDHRSQYMTVDGVGQRPLSPFLSCCRGTIFSFKLREYIYIYLHLSLQIFEMMDAKARQDCIKEIDLLKVKLINHSHRFQGLSEENKLFFSIVLEESLRTRANARTAFECSFDFSLLKLVQMIGCICPYYRITSAVHVD